MRKTSKIVTMRGLALSILNPRQRNAKIYDMVFHKLNEAVKDGNSTVRIQQLRFLKSLDSGSHTESEKWLVSQLSDYSRLKSDVLSEKIKKYLRERIVRE